MKQSLRAMKVAVEETRSTTTSPRSIIPLDSDRWTFRGGYHVAKRRVTVEITGRALLVEQGTHYPALFRLVRQGMLKARWGISENNRRARIYELSAAAGKLLREEMESWRRLAAAMAVALAMREEEI